jgi:hypothetical protein
MKKVILIASAKWVLVPPMGILAVGSYLAVHDVPVELIDIPIDFGFGPTATAASVVRQRVARYLRQQADSVAWVGISEVSAYGDGILLAQEIRAALPDIPIILGSYFPSSTYRRLLTEYPFITAIVRGDGETAALQISRSMAQGQSFLSDRTPGLAWLDGGEIRTTPIQPMALSDLPTLDFELLQNPGSYQIIGLVTSRGCPYLCNYCLENSMRPYATYSLEWVARQLDSLPTDLPDRIFIYDPVFGLGRERTLEICQVWRGRRFSYAMESRVDVLLPNHVPALREAGVQIIYLGMESASAATLLRMNKVHSQTSAESYVRKARAVLKACFGNDVTPVVGFMFSFPGDSEPDYHTSLEFVKEIERLHDRITARTGVRTGFVIMTSSAKVYDGSSLAEQMATDFPEAILQPESFIGDKTVLSPSRGLDPAVSRHYRIQMEQHGRHTPLALERRRHYF